MGRWASEHDTLQAFIPPGQSWHNGFVESLHNRMRDELLEDNMFEDLNHARALIGAWSHRYNEEHPTVRWAGSHPTNTHANGTTPPITTNNPQNTRSTKPDQAISPLNTPTLPDRKRPTSGARPPIITR